MSFRSGHRAGTSPARVVPRLRLSLAEPGEASARCAGRWLEAAAGRQTAMPGSALTMRATALNRSQGPRRLEQVHLEPADRSLTRREKTGDCPQRRGSTAGRSPHSR